MSGMADHHWLQKISKLNVYRAKHGRAPHKPLLLLALLELAELNELPNGVIWLTPELSSMPLW
jgi:putative restriction endonuclease